MASLRKETSREDIRRLLIDKIEALKKELSFYEYILRLLEHTAPQEESAPQKQVLEIKADNKTIGMIERLHNAISIRLTKDIYEQLFEPESLSRRLKILGEGIKLNVSTDEKGIVRELEVTGISSSILLDGVIEIVKQYVIDRYYLSASSKKQGSP